MESEKKWTNDVCAVKCAKRGNDVYKSRVERRFRGICRLSENLIFFNPKDRNSNRTTKALFLTLTYDTKRSSYSEAWKSIGVEFNSFMAKIRKEFGKVSSCRVFESFENGYPHIHCILLFEKEFSVFRDRQGKLENPQL